ncbi:MAG: phage tail protein [Bacillus sp. (in: firmicutes)]
MVVTIIEEFDAIRITNASIQFKKNGVQQPGTRFGCLGKLEGETEMKEFVKRCEGIEVKKVSKPQKILLTLTGHISVEVARDIFGLSNVGLKAGVYSYGADSKALPFVFTADVIDDFEDIVKHIAFANCSSNTGLKINVENGGDEVVEVEMEFTVMLDSKNNLYYEAFADEVEDQTVIEKWHTQFTPGLVDAAINQASLPEVEGDESL